MTRVRYDKGTLFLCTSKGIHSGFFFLKIIFTPVELYYSFFFFLVCKRSVLDVEPCFYSSAVGEWKECTAGGRIQIIKRIGVWVAT